MKTELVEKSRILESEYWTKCENIDNAPAEVGSLGGVFVIHRHQEKIAGFKKAVE